MDKIYPERFTALAMSGELTTMGLAVKRSADEYISAQNAYIVESGGDVAAAAEKEDSTLDSAHASPLYDTDDSLQWELLPPLFNLDGYEGEGSAEV
jgi:hypothetical protein